MSDEHEIGEAMGVSAAWFAQSSLATGPSGDTSGYTTPPERVRRKARPQARRATIVALTTAVQLLLGSPGAIAASACGAYFLVRAFVASSSDLTVVSGVQPVAVGVAPADLAHAGLPHIETRWKRWAAMCIGDTQVFIASEGGGQTIGGPCPQGEVAKPTAVVDREVTWALPVGLALSLGGALWQAVIEAVPFSRARRTSAGAD